ncbi:MAG: hypothetical protein U0R19_01935 [Bryobacteraceae bacterium]
MKTTDVAKWSAWDWKWRLLHAKPSGDGAVGVIFCWSSMQSIYQGGTDYNKFSTADFVLKPIFTSGANPKFAEFILKVTGAAVTVNSEPIKRNSSAGNAIIEAIRHFVNTERVGTPLRTKWEAMLPHLMNCTAFLVQDTVKHFHDFGKEYRSNGPRRGLREILRDQNLMHSLGKLFAVDAIIGNGDRLCYPNTGNILYGNFGDIYAIDTTTVLTNFNEMVNDQTKITWVLGHEPGKPDNFATEVVKRGGMSIPSHKQQDEYVQDAKSNGGFSDKHVPSQPGFAMREVFDPAGWWDREFRPHLEKGLKAETEKNLGNRVAPPVPPRPMEWANAKTWFIAGVDDGVRIVDEKLSGANWMMVKMQWKKYVFKYGGDPNLDWTNFKMRRLYFKARKAGKSEEQALAEVKQYALKKIA